METEFNKINVTLTIYNVSSQILMKIFSLLVNVLYQNSNIH